MNITEIKDLMSQFDQSSLREFSYSNAGETLHFSKNQQAIAAPSPKLEAPLAPVAPANPAVPAAETSEPAPAEASVSPVAEGAVVESPLVGVAYLSPSPDKPAFVAVGETVKKGQTLMIIEAMKVMNPIKATSGGIVKEILIRDGKPVEFGEPLLIVA